VRAEIHAPAPNVNICSLRPLARPPNCRAPPTVDLDC
jgi:hypothetical protein